VCFDSAGSIQIISTRLDFLQDIQEHDRILLRLLAQRAPEWQSQQGICRMITRIKIELWAWRETARELRKRDRRQVFERA
jgi:hypothetical protein